MALNSTDPGIQIRGSGPKATSEAFREHRRVHRPRNVRGPTSPSAEIESLSPLDRLIQVTTASDDHPKTARFPVPEAHTTTWAMNAYRVRACELVLGRTGDPVPRSPLDRADAVYHWEKVSAWARNYLLASAEQLSLWADLVAPYNFAPDAINTVRMRPYLLLARSGLEAAAHAIWLLDVPKIDECVQRHVRLMHRDFTLHKKALDVRGEDASLLADRLTSLIERATTLPFDTSPTTRPPGYEALVKNAAAATGNDESEWAYLWNAASGAGHGQNWFGIEGFNLLPSQEYQPGYFRAASIPDPVFITETIEAAALSLQWGTLRWLSLGGHDPSLVQAATLEVHSKMPKKADDVVTSAGD